MILFFIVCNNAIFVSASIAGIRPTYNREKPETYTNIGHNIKAENSIPDLIPQENNSYLISLILIFGKCNPLISLFIIFKSGITENTRNITATTENKFLLIINNKAPTIGVKIFANPLTIQRFHKFFAVFSFDV